MSLLADTVAVLESANIDHALIGAAALAVHGVSRATADVDLFTVDSDALQRGLWTDLEKRGASIRLLKGDFEDPLAGSVRLSVEGDRTVDVVVGRYEWQAEIIEASDVMALGEVSVKVVDPVGLVLLKLYAGGPKDAWDIRSLLEAHERADDIVADVDGRVERLPKDCRQLWNQVRDER